MSSRVCLSRVDVGQISPVKPGFLPVSIQLRDDHITDNSNKIYHGFYISYIVGVEVLTV